MLNDNDNIIIRKKSSRALSPKKLSPGKKTNISDQNESLNKSNNSGIFIRDKVNTRSRSSRQKKSPIINNRSNN